MLITVSCQPEDLLNIWFHVFTVINLHLFKTYKRFRLSQASSDKQPAVFTQ